VFDRYTEMFIILKAIEKNPSMWEEHVLSQ